MKRLAFLTAITLIAATAFAQAGRRAPNDSFASDLQTIPVVANTAGFNGAQFTTYMALFNPTSSSITITATFYDANGTATAKPITLAAGELRTYSNFLADVFNMTGGGAVTLRGSDRFIANSEVRSGGYGTPVPALEFAGSSSRSFAPGVTVDSSSRTNVGCFNQSDAANMVKATVFDNTGHQQLGSVTLNLAPKAWGQTGIPAIVSGGYVQFDPSDSAVCYAVVVSNATNDGRFISAAEYRP